MNREKNTTNSNTTKDLIQILDVKLPTEIHVNNSGKTSEILLSCED